MPVRVGLFLGPSDLAPEAASRRPELASDVEPPVRQLESVGSGAHRDRPRPCPPPGSVTRCGAEEERGEESDAARGAHRCCVGVLERWLLWGGWAVGKAQDGVSGRCPCARVHHPRRPRPEGFCSGAGAVGSALKSPRSSPPLRSLSCLCVRTAFPDRAWKRTRRMVRTPRQRRGGERERQLARPRRASARAGGWAMELAKGMGCT